MERVMETFAIVIDTFCLRYQALSFLSITSNKENLEVFTNVLEAKFY